MESLPSTSDIKKIDIWLILCQLVPFSQVVLLTAMEFLREDEQEGNQVLEREEMKEAAEPINGNLEGIIQFEMEDESKPKEAWTVVPMKHSWTSFLPMLAVIGMSTTYYVVVVEIQQ